MSIWVMYLNGHIINFDLCNKLMDPICRLSMLVYFWTWHDHNWYENMNSLKKHYGFLYQIDVLISISIWWSILY